MLGIIPEQFDTVGQIHITNKKPLTLKSDIQDEFESSNSGVPALDRMNRMDRMSGVFTRRGPASPTLRRAGRKGCTFLGIGGETGNEAGI
jgi:hypothetical protein